MKFLKPIMKNIAVVMFAITTLTGCAQTKNIKTDGKTLSIATLNTAIEKAMNESKLPGLSIAIINKKQLVYHQVFGVSNSNTKEPLNNQSMFEGASLSKPIFAYFVMKMVENGTIELDKPLHEWC